MKLLQAWIELHKDELLADWELTLSGQQPYKIEPLWRAMNPRIPEVVPTENYKLPTLFTNGEKGYFDCSGLLDFGIFQELRDMNYFWRVTVSNGTVVWPHKQDICPDTIYIDSVKERS